MTSLESVARDTCARIMRVVEGGVADLVTAAQNANPLSTQLLESELASAKERIRQYEISINDLKRERARQSSSADLELAKTRKALQEHEHLIPKLRLDVVATEHQLSTTQSLLQQHENTIGTLKAEAMRQTITLKVDLEKAHDTLKAKEKELASLNQHVSTGSSIDVHQRLSESRESEMKAKESLSIEIAKLAEIRSFHREEVYTLKMQRDIDIQRLSSETAKLNDIRITQRDENLELKNQLSNERSRNGSQSTVDTMAVHHRLQKSVEDEAKATIALAKELARSADLQRTHHEELSNLKLQLVEQRLKNESIVGDAVRAEREKLRIQSDSMMEQIGKQGGAIEVLKATNSLLQKQAERTTKMTPGELGTAGEDEIELYLRSAFGGFMTVRNVSKIRQGHEMDLLLITRDGSVTIRVDVKNGQTVQEDEITRFYGEVTSLKPPPDAAIMFMRCALKCVNAESSTQNVDRKRRDTTFVIQIGSWSKEMLIESIISVIVDRKIELSSDSKHPRNLKGTKEIGKTVESLSTVIVAQNQTIAHIHQVTARGNADMAAHTRNAAECPRLAHSANATVIPEAVLTRFEKKIPKRPRGKPPTIKKSKSFFSDTDSDDSDQPNRKRRKAK